MTRSPKRKPKVRLITVEHCVEVRVGRRTVGWVEIVYSRGWRWEAVFQARDGFDKRVKSITAGAAYLIRIDKESRNAR